jgi:hypothetical protein
LWGIVSYLATIPPILVDLNLNISGTQKHFHLFKNIHRDEKTTLL